MRNSKVIKSVIIAAFAGLAAIPGLFYAYAVRPVQSVASNVARSDVQDAEIVHKAATTGHILFAAGALFLLLLIIFVALAFYLEERNLKDLKGKK